MIGEGDQRWGWGGAGGTPVQSRSKVPGLYSSDLGRTEVCSMHVHTHYTHTAMWAIGAYQSEREGDQGKK